MKDAELSKAYFLNMLPLNIFVLVHNYFRIKVVMFSDAILHHYVCSADEV